MKRNRILGAGLLIALAVLVPGGGSTVGQEEEAQPADALVLSSDLRIRTLSGREILLEVRVAAGDGYTTIAHRVASGAAAAEEISEYNGRRALNESDWAAVPISLLSPSYRSFVLRVLFPEDARDGEDWIHVAQSGRMPTYDEGLWQVAEWFTGDGSRYPELMQVNGLSSPELRRGQRVRIPASLLHAALKKRLLSDDAMLEYGSDDQGPFAAYRLKAGEALYSAVVVRFTGRTGSDDVWATAAQVQERSSIRDLRDIPVGFEVRIPLDLLEPQFLPAGHPRRLEAEAASEELARELERKPVAGTRGGLEGVLVVLDPGHGGRDLGTVRNGIWEHDYVYDVACRLKLRLEEQTSAHVVMTLEDRETGCRPSTTDKLKANKQGTILTTPPFLARAEGEARIGVNLRWYLTNSIYREALKNGFTADRVVFLSLHGDSRHSSLRGLMVYVPGAAYRTRKYGKSSRTYRKYEEVREQPYVSFSRKQRVRSEAVSRKLADSIVHSFREAKLPVQPHQPVRNRIIRGKRRFVPAVIRSNNVPNKVLVEMVNLANRDDAKLLAKAVERQRLADALLRSLYHYFGERPEPSAVTAAHQ